MNAFEIQHDAKAKLIALQKKEKFQQEAEDFNWPVGYIGLEPEENRPLANQLMNESIGRLLQIIDSQPTLDRILAEYRIGLETFVDIAFDTEDRERVCAYYDEIRQIIGFDSTEGILNDWLYG
jgi:hypothetical protein